MPRDRYIPQHFVIPAKYLGFGAGSYSHYPLASGVEAQLITAEVALHAGDANWLAMLNTLRRTVPGGLPPLSDPTDPKARVALLFTERAEWLYLTGARQGDLRRLLRNYHRENDYFTQRRIWCTPLASIPHLVRVCTGQTCTNPASRDQYQSSHPRSA